MAWSFQPLVPAAADLLAGAASSTGSLDAFETGSDVSSASGLVIVSGALSGVETGLDSFAATGTAIQDIVGDLDALESVTDTLVSSGSVLVSGALSVLEPGLDDALSASGSVIVSGDLAIAESVADTFSASGLVFVSGDLAAVESVADSLVADGGVLIQGSADAVESGSDVASASGTVTDPAGPISGSAEIMEQADSIDISGSVSQPVSVMSQEDYGVTGRIPRRPKQYQFDITVLEYELNLAFDIAIERNEFDDELIAGIMGLMEEFV